MNYEFKSIKYRKGMNRMDKSIVALVPVSSYDQAEVDAAVAYVKGREDSKPYHDLSARRIVDAGIALVVAALFVMLSEKGVPGKEAALWFWLNVEFPRVRAGLEVVKGGYAAQVAEFEALAPAVPDED